MAQIRKGTVKMGSGGRRNPIDNIGGGPGDGGTTRGGGSSRTTRTGTPRVSTNTNPPARRISPGKRLKTNTMSNAYDTWDGKPQTRKQFQAAMGAFGMRPTRSSGNGQKLPSPKKGRVEVKAQKRLGFLTKPKGATSKQMKDARVAARKAK
jgi:hypothetical protein